LESLERKPRAENAIFSTDQRMAHQDWRQATLQGRVLGDVYLCGIELRPSGVVRNLASCFIWHGLDGSIIEETLY